VYTVKLSVDGKTFVRQLTLKMDPRAPITPLGLSRQFTLASRIADMMNRTHAALTPSSSESPAARVQSDLTALNTDLATAYDVVEGADRAPTAQAVRTVNELERRVIALLK
jgi:hypothetical protein